MTTLSSAPKLRLFYPWSNASTSPSTFTSSARCVGSTSEEARNCRRSYQQEAARSEELTRFGDDYIGFLRSCSITVTIRAFAERDSAVSPSLCSGQTNSTSQAIHILATRFAPSWTYRAARSLAPSCADRFGVGNGNVGFCIVRFSPERIVVDDFMLSCRVQNKLVEQALFSHLIAIHPGRAPMLAV